MKDIDSFGIGRWVGMNLKYFFREIGFLGGAFFWRGGDDGIDFIVFDPTALAS